MNHLREQMMNDRPETVHAGIYWMTARKLYIFHPNTQKEVLS